MTAGLVMRSVAVLVLVWACACRSDAPDIALLLATLDDPRTVREAQHFEARARELGLDVITLGADHTGARQLAQVEDVLARGAKVLVVQPADAATSSTFVRLAHERGAKLVAYGRAIVSPDLDYLVAHDSYRVGVLQAEAAIAATGGKGTFLLLAGEGASEVTRGHENTLAPYVARGAVQVVVEHHRRKSSLIEARSTVDNALSRSEGKVDAILATDSSLARGAVQAIAARQLAHVFIAGADAEAANVNFVCQGKQTIEILKDAVPLARTAAEVAKRLFDRESPKRGSATVELGGGDVPVEPVRVELVTSANVKPLLVDSGVLLATDLPACKDQLASY